MSLGNKVSYYARFSTYADMLGKDVVAYIYAKEERLVDFQLSHLKFFSKTNNLNIKNVYVDTFGSNKLENKINLKKLIDENSNINVLVTGIDRLSRNTMDLFDIKNLCENKNIVFYDISSDKFIFDNFFHTFEKVIEEIANKGSDEELQRTIDVLYIEPNKLPVKKTIKNTLEEKQKLVGGYIEYTYLEDCDDVAVVCNEEGKIYGLPPNRDIGHDIIVGNFFLVGDDTEIGEDRSLTEEQIAKYTKYFGKESIEKTTKKYNQILDSSLDI